MPIRPKARHRAGFLHLPYEQKISTTLQARTTESEALGADTH